MAKGFTLIETLVSLCVLGIIAGLSIAFGMGAYRHAGAGNAADEVRSLLIQARADALAGIGGSAHGVCADGGSLRLYEDAPDMIERALPIAADVELRGIACSAGGVLFAAYAATTTAAAISVSFDGASATITVNEEGGIE
jgi:prepilin-type N-terminal cleavage/methylation domain-containing protein